MTSLARNSLMTDSGLTAMGNVFLCEEGAKLSISLKSVGISLDYTQPQGCDGNSRKASVRTGIYTDVR